MTNIELIKELLTTVENRGVLPVHIDIEALKGDTEEVQDVRYCEGCVTLYNY